MPAPGPGHHHSIHNRGIIYYTFTLHFSLFGSFPKLWNIAKNLKNFLSWYCSGQIVRMSLAWAEAAEAVAWLVDLARQPGHGTRQKQQHIKWKSYGLLFWFNQLLNCSIATDPLQSCSIMMTHDIHTIISHFTTSWCIHQLRTETFNVQCSSPSMAQWHSYLSTYYWYKIIKIQNYTIHSI